MELLTDLKVYLIVWALKLMNVVDRVLQRFGIRMVRLSRELVLKDLPDEVHDEIQQPDIKFLFEETMKAVEGEGEMTFFGRVAMLELWKDTLRTRLLVKETVQQIPDILKVPVRSPMFIVGPPRTGTTFLHWLLSRDKQFRSPMLWEQLQPCPPGPVADYTKDPRYQKIAFNIKLRKAYLSRNAFAAHASEADKPEECVIPMLRSFYNAFLRFPLHCLDKYSRTMDSLGGSDPMVAVYQYYKKNLQLLAYKHDMEQKRFLLKAPNHLLHIEALLKVFPDAQLIFTHRRLSEIVPSFLSLTKIAMNDVYGGVEDLKWRDRILAALRAWHVCALKTLDQLEHSRGSNNPMYVLAYSDLTADPLGEMRRVYAYFGMRMSGETEAALAHFLDNDPKKKEYGSHKYSLEEFGLTVDDLKREFSEYIELMVKRGRKIEEVL